MLGTVAEVFDRAVDVLTVVLALGCLWLGCRALLRPRRSPEPIQGSVWGVRAWGLGFVLVGDLPRRRDGHVDDRREAGLAGGCDPPGGRAARGRLDRAGPCRPGWQCHRTRKAKGGPRA